MARGTPSWLSAMRETRGRGVPLLWLAALLVGAVSGIAAILFFHALFFIEDAVFGPGGAGSHPAQRPILFIAPIIGGCLIAPMVLWSQRHGSGRAGSAAEAIEARLVRDGLMPVQGGVLSAAISVISLGFGASGGRQGPIVHLGAWLGSLASRALALEAPAARILLSGGVAAAIAASFNAPIAGVLFALEVVLGHYALSAVAPIVIASTAGTVLGRLFRSDETVFLIPAHHIGGYWEMPAFFLLGLLCAFCAMFFARMMFFSDACADKIARRIRLPLWGRPILAGCALGGLGYFVPPILGVGVTINNYALNVLFDWPLALGLIVAKLAAISISFAGRFGGGVFSPALYLGSLLGGVFGLGLTSLLPLGMGDPSVYALVGMGAMAAAILGAPIATTLIIFELTLDYPVTIAVMIANSVACAVSKSIAGGSFFHAQLRRRGLEVVREPQLYLRQTLQVGLAMRWTDKKDFPPLAACRKLAAQGLSLHPDNDMRDAFTLFERHEGDFLPVLEKSGETILGALYYADALRAYNRVLEETYREEHS